MPRSEQRDRASNDRCRKEKKHRIPVAAAFHRRNDLMPLRGVFGTGQRPSGGRNLSGRGAGATGRSELAEPCQPEPCRAQDLSASGAAPGRRVSEPRLSLRDRLHSDRGGLLYLVAVIAWAEPTRGSPGRSSAGWSADGEPGGPGLAALEDVELGFRAKALEEGLAMASRKSTPRISAAKSPIAPGQSSRRRELATWWSMRQLDAAPARKISGTDRGGQCTLRVQACCRLRQGPNTIGFAAPLPYEERRTTKPTSDATAAPSCSTILVCSNWPGASWWQPEHTPPSTPMAQEPRISSVRQSFLDVIEHNSD